MRAEIINIGTELLLGSVLNTNQQYLAQWAAKLGIDVFYQTTIGDNPKRLAATLHTALLRSELVITTGGLGPTQDDVTVRTISEALGLQLKQHHQSLKRINWIASQGKKKLNKEVLRQVHVPEKSITLPNRVGTAPGSFITVKYAENQKHVLLLPGPPQELIPMCERFAAPLINKVNKDQRHTLLVSSLKIQSVSEPEVSPRVWDLLNAKPPVTVGIYARPGEVELKIMSKARTKTLARKGLNKVKQQILKRFGDALILEDDDALENHLSSLLKKRNKSLALAESCTGGLLGHMITNVPGSSKFFYGSVTAYDNRIKKALVDVTDKTLKDHGAVSPATAKALAKGIRLKFNTDFGLSITGIAGPSGGSKKKPVGLVYIGVADTKRMVSRRFFFLGDRATIKEKAARAAITSLVQFITPPK